MSDARFTLIFEGPAVDNGEIDVRDLAPSLLSLGELLQAANAAINGERASVAVKLHATRAGSFEVDMTMVQSLAAQAGLLLDQLAGHRDSLAAAKDLADIIFKVGAGAAAIGGGFFALIKWLKNRKPDRIEERGGDTIIHIGDTYFVTNARAVALAENLEVREQAKKLVSVLRSDGIDRLSTKTDGERLTISKQEADYFEIPVGDDETLEDAKREMYLQIDSLSFKEGNKWKVTDGGEPFYAVIEDAEFLNRIAKGEVSFSKTDHLHCMVHERQVRTIRGQLRKERTIVKVLEHKPGARQLKLL